MYPVLLQIHHYLSYLVVLLAVYVTIKAWIGYTGKKRFLPADEKSGLAFSILFDIQVLAGLILYVFVSPITKAGFADMGATMKNADLRFYVIEHIMVMLIALVLIHIGRSKTKKAHTDISKHKTSAIFYTIGLILILSRFPWDKIFA